MPAILTSCRDASEARQAGAPFRVLSAGEAAEFEAIAARIVPTDDTPGATEAGVIRFMDQVLAGIRADSLEPMRAGLAELKTAAQETHGVPDFHALGPQQQDALLTQIEDSDFFATVRYLTLAGMFSLPEHGGNQDGVGWKLLGFDGRQAWQPPFGFYDADYAERGE
jgi:gluconate 2-dehydrogenase gamma chain